MKNGFEPTKRPSGRSRSTVSKAASNSLTVPTFAKRSCNPSVFGGESQNFPAAGDDHSDLTLGQVGCQRRQPINLTFRPTVFDRHVPPFDIAGLTQTVAERLHEMFKWVGRCAVEEPDHRHGWLLSARRKRPS